MTKKTNGFQLTTSAGIKPGFVFTMRAYPDRITSPISIPSPHIEGAHLMPIGSGKELAMCVTIRSWGGKGNG